MNCLLILSLIPITPSLILAGDRLPPVKVFILAGQSNMEGKAKVSLLEYQLGQPGTGALFKNLKKNGKWIERDDVWIRYHQHKGKLTVGYHNPKTIGPELGFGLVVGDHYKGQVLLIKSAWGGRSLYRDFRPPSARLPPQTELDKTLANIRKMKPEATMDEVTKPFGASYREMLSEVQSTLRDLKGQFPDYSGQGYEIAGFIWFQGWNDMISADYTAAYPKNMELFIRDVRRDLKTPRLPFVIGQMGVDGLKADKGIQKFKAAQAEVLKVPEFEGNVALVKTDVFWDMEADAVFRKGWRENLEAWNKVGSDYPYHYLGSPKTMLAIGRAFGEAVLSLRGGKSNK
jgi:hypothetical protein